MGKLRTLQRALAEANDHNGRLQHRLSEVMSHAWTLQMVCAAMLQKLTDGGAVVLTLEERKIALEEEWGIETSVIDTDPAEPMCVRIIKKGEAQAMEFGGQVPLDGRQIGEDHRG